MDARSSYPASQNFTPLEQARSQSRIYVGDTCTSKLDPNKIGVVARTHGDIDSHSLHVNTQHPDGITRDDRISHEAYRVFLKTGIPPRDAIVITWMDPEGVYKPTSGEILPESEVIVTDRELLVGDVVKLNAQDAQSGTVVSESIWTNLIQPRGWPSETNSAGSSGRTPFDANGKLMNVPAAELDHTISFFPDQIVLYKGWVGKVLDYWDEIRVRLSDGSVVELQDPEMIEEPNDVGDDPAQVGDFVTTKKSNLRRGTWIFGAYNANVAPSGYVTDIRLTSIEMEWLQQRYHTDQPESSDPPPNILEKPEIESGELHLVDPSMLPPALAGRSKLSRIQTVNVEIGDAVRFRDLAGAAVNYGDKLKAIPRLKTLGYDINVFTVAATHTEVTVLWQDLHKTNHSTLDLIPALDFDKEDDVWPGELIVTKKKAITSDQSTYQPERVGIAQSVNARDRIASVKWFEGSVSFAGDDHSVLLPGCRTGRLSVDAEDISMYDVWTVPGLTRRLGDYVVLIPPATHHSPTTYAGLALYRDIWEALNSPGSTRDWFGEVIDLGLDGLLTIRLCVASDIRDIQVPWECTIIAYGSDHETNDVDAEDADDAYDEMDHDDPLLVDWSTSPPTPWMNEDDQVITDAEQTEWTTDDDEDGGTDERDVPMVDAPEVQPQRQPSVSNGTESTRKFTYDSMFQSMDDDAKSETAAFAVLDGAVPSDHHYAGRLNSSSGIQRLRRIQKEHQILRSSLPAGVFVRGWETSLDLLRVLIIGPLDTPYEYAPFVIDIWLDEGFPTQPPQAFFHSWTDGTGNVNPNLYEDGKICLSLLGTWPGDDANDVWKPQSTILQVLVSLLGLVLVKEPYYNEAGFEVRAGTAESKIPSALYSERSYLTSRLFILRALDQPIGGFDDLINELYTVGVIGSPLLLRRAIWDAIRVILRSPSAPGAASRSGGRTLEEDRSVSAGALIPLKRHTEALIARLEQFDSTASSTLRGFLYDARAQAAIDVEQFINQR